MMKWPRQNFRALANTNVADETVGNSLRLVNVLPMPRGAANAQHQWCFRIML
jgi:hypothetical protein